MRKGITLIETVTYLAIFGTLFLGVMYFSLSISEGNRNTYLKKELNNNIVFIEEHLNDSFSKTTSIDTTNSIFSNNSSKLHLINNSGGYYDYSLSGGILNFSNNGTINPITSPLYNITNFYLDKLISANGTTNGVRLTITITYPQNTSIFLNTQLNFTLK